MNLTHKRLWIGVLVAALIIVGLCNWTNRKVFVAPCRVKVTGKAGGPLANLRVSESWNAYSYDLAGGLDKQTDANGIAVFPAQSSMHSVLFWAVSPIVSRFKYGAHASTGITASIIVSEPGLTVTDGDARGFTCTDRECIDHPLEFEVTLAGR